jgi:hypothetical protein
MTTMAVLVGSGFYLASALGVGGTAAQGTVLSASDLGKVVSIRTNANLVSSNSIMHIGDGLIVDTDNDGLFGDETAATQTDNDRFVNSTVTYADGSTSNVTLELVSLSDGTQVILLADNGANAVNAVSSSITSITLGTFDTTFDNRYDQDNFNNIITNNVVCFCDNTLIQTPGGERLIAELAAGDEVVAAESGVQKIVWIGRRALTTAELVASPHFKPVRIPAGALGLNTPRTDLFVSPQHRMLLVSKTAKRMFGETEIFVPAIKLVGTNGIEQASSVGPVTYAHILFDTHQIVFANGAPAESLYLGRQALQALSDEASGEVFEIFPTLGAGAPTMPLARQTIQKKSLIDKLLERHRRNCKELVLLEHPTGSAG